MLLITTEAPNSCGSLGTFRGRYPSGSDDAGCHPHSMFFLGGCKVPLAAAACGVPGLRAESGTPARPIWGADVLFANLCPEVSGWDGGSQFWGHGGHGPTHRPRGSGNIQDILRLKSGSLFT